MRVGKGCGKGCGNERRKHASGIRKAQGGSGEGSSGEGRSGERGVQGKGVFRVMGPFFF